MDTIASRIKNKRKELGLSQPEVAAKCGWESQSRISHYESGNRGIKISDIKRLANALETTPEYLLFGNQKPKTGSENTPQSQIPIIGWHQVAQWYNPDDKPITLGDSPEYVPSPDPSRPTRHLYALRIKNDSMIGSGKAFNTGSIIIVDPDKAPNHGDYILGAREGQQEAIFRQYIVEGGRGFLKPLNTQYPLEEIVGGFLFCGVVIMHRDDFK